MPTNWILLIFFILPGYLFLWLTRRQRPVGVELLLQAITWSGVFMLAVIFLTPHPDKIIVGFIGFSQHGAIKEKKLYGDFTQAIVAGIWAWALSLFIGLAVKYRLCLRKVCRTEAWSTRMSRTPRALLMYIIYSSRPIFDGFPYQTGDY